MSGTPFKMKGYTLPGPNQNPASPLRALPALAIAAIAAVAGGVASAGVSRLMQKKSKTDITPMGDLLGQQTIGTQKKPGYQTPDTLASTAGKDIYA